MYKLCLNEKKTIAHKCYTETAGKLIKKYYFIIFFIGIHSLCEFFIRILNDKIVFFYVPDFYNVNFTHSIFICPTI